jgi:hypothetical protein
MNENVKKMLENLGVSINIDAAGVDIAGLKSVINYSQDKNMNILQLSVDPKITKDQIKARLLEPGKLQVEWPKTTQDQEIPVQ